MPSGTAAPAPVRICFLGDSFVQGVGDPQYRGWVGRVLEASAAPHLDITGFNLGVRRNTSDDVLARCWAETDRRTAPDADNRLVVSFGSNDAVEEGGAPRVDPGRTEANLTRLLAEASHRAVPVLVVGPPPVADAGPAHLERLLALADRLRAVCARAGAPWIPVTRTLAQDAVWHTEASSGDGAHPDAGGYDRLAGLVLAAGWHHWLTTGAADPD